MPGPNRDLKGLFGPAPSALLPSARRTVGPGKEAPRQPGTSKREAAQTQPDLPHGALPGLPGPGP